MKSAIDLEFETVDLILKSDARTKSVDAFCLTWIKFERQLRKLTANILYQATVFQESDRTAKEALRAALLAKNNIKHDHFMGGIRKLTGQTMKDIIGDRHKELRKAVNLAYGFRNKILHGQQTGQNLDKEQLVSSQNYVRDWCTLLAREGTARFGYDGFARDSLRKTHRALLVGSVDQAIEPTGWEGFVAAL
ncbi:hypothetical protein [Mesorhizobium sp.]|uniref:hypothetical protein n=1 Tax=Mesorhizobium sp. TaxID=1871066 RepID=UPI000FE70B9E|nr:hypothetical protein [Mesorhizobium sp.]RWE30478.1 MAG: hypothetical protein EOS77_19755 [Mesorhizobium sp.]